MSGDVAADALPGVDSALWYLARGTGTVSLLLLTAVVVLGVLVRRGAPVARLPRFVVSGLHRNLSLLALALLGVHITASVVDPFAPIRLADALVPFASRYRPVWLGLGAAALDLVLALLATSLVRLWLGRRLWRAVHWGGFAAWPVALVHGLGTGSDTGQSWMLALTAACLATVLGAVLWRLGAAPRLDRRLRAGLITLVVAAPAMLTGWLVAGPLAPGWAARSGTPPELLSGLAELAPPIAARASTGPVTAAGVVRWPTR